MKSNLLLLFFIASLLTFNSNAQNLIPNGSFENDFTSWNNLVGGNGSATFSIDTNDKVDSAKAMKVVVTTPGANAYDIQSINSPWASASGKEYTLSFYAKADVAGKTLRVVQQTTTYAQKDFSLTTSWQKYEWFFTAQEANLQLRFNFPVTGTFNIDQVSIPAPVPPSVDNLIPNGSFENDFTNWNNLVTAPGQASFVVDNNDKVDGAKAMKVIATTAGANAYDIQSINSPWASVTGKEYTLSFYAKADVAGKTLRVVQQTNTYAQREFILTTAWQKYEWTFTAQEANLQLRFNFPVAGTFNIDQVSIPAPVTPSVINLIPNGGFENNFTNWTNLAGGTGSATYSVETVDKVQGSKAMKVAVAAAGANGYDVQSINSAWASVAGKEYTLSFFAKADVAGKTLRVVQQTNTYAQKDFSLTASWQKYEWVFTAQEANLQLRFNFPVAGTFYIDTVSIPSANVVFTPPPPYTPSGPPMATGKSKFLGSVYSAAQKVNFTAYFNQVTAENAGKWGVVEGTRNVMNWAELDSAYKLAKDNGFPFKMHTLIWGSQQPAWIETLDAATQLAEIKEWFQAVATRYPDIDFIEVVNEPLHAKPEGIGQGKGNYINALGGNGATGWDWVINSFRLARQYFPKSKLWINDYSIVNSSQSTATYMQIINLLKAENLIDGIGEQAHAFTTTASNATMLTNLNTLATSGLPLYATELDIDGPPAETPQGNAIQLQQYQRIFPLFWEHPAVKGITLWGHRPGHWRTAEGAPLTYANGAEKPAMEWLKQYLKTETVTDPAPLTASATVGTISCNGGTTTVTISATGGTPPYKGTGTFTVHSGPYTYTVTDDKGRTTTISGTIAEPGKLLASASAGNISCYGQTTTITIAATGGTEPYSGIGSFTVTAGPYSYTVTDAKGCTTSTSITLSQPSALTASVADVYAVSPGGSANTIYIGYGPTSVTLKAVATGATPSYTYSWKAGTSASVIGTGQSLVVNPSIAGIYNYTVTITDSKGCNVVVTKSIKVVDIRCGTNKVTICKLPPGNPSDYRTECVKTNDVAAALSQGSYLGSCVNNTIAARSSTVPEVSDKEARSDLLKVFPNPSDGNFNVTLNNAKAGKAQLVFMDVRGVVIETKSIEKVQGLQNVTFTHRNLASGMYILKVVSEDAVQTQHVIIAR